MRHLITSVAVAALLALPAAANSRGRGNGKGTNKGHAAEGNDSGRGNGNGQRNGKGHGKKDGKGRVVHGHDRRGTGKARADANRAGIQTLLRNVVGLTATNGVIYLTPDVDFAAITDDDLAAIANCPPGLAKKDPPCVPPGLARQGVGFVDWASYDPVALRRLLDDRFADVPPVATPAPLDLTQARIAEIFGIAPAPEGFRYAVIDGRPVQLNAADYDRLLTLNTLARRPTIPGGVTIVPDAALTQDQLIARYGLPGLADGQNYAVLDNQIIALPDQSYDMLQLIRILGAV